MSHTWKNIVTHINKTAAIFAVVAVFACIGASSVSAAPRSFLAIPLVNSAQLINDSDVNLPKPDLTGSNSTLVKNVTSFVFGGMAIISVIFVVIGGLKYTLSGGDAQAVASAKNTILYAVIGLALGVSVFVIVNFVLGKL